jgi:CheY-like chemotaxis protein
MKKIMMVDDEKDQIFSIKTVLEKKYGDEYKVIPANNGSECIELLENNEIPDLILLDIMMPEISGWQVFDKLKDNPLWKDIPVIFLTARTDELAERAGSFLADDFIEKPVEAEELKKKIDAVLNKGKIGNNFS